MSCRLRGHVAKPCTFTINIGQKSPTSLCITETSGTKFALTIISEYCQFQGSNTWSNTMCINDASFASCLLLLYTLIAFMASSACHICWEQFDWRQGVLRPRTLPCGHTVCSGCLGKRGVDDDYLLRVSVCKIRAFAQGDFCGCLGLLASARRVGDRYADLTRSCTRPTMHLKPCWTY